MTSGNLESKLDSLKRENRLNDEVDQVLKAKQTSYKPSAHNSSSILKFLFFPRLVNDYATEKSPSRHLTSTSSFIQLISYNFYHIVLVFLFFCYSAVRGVEYFYRRIRLRSLALTYNPSQSPQLIRQDINKLDKIPTRVSAVLTLKSEEEEGGGIDGLINDAGELVSWCVAAGIPFLTLFEHNGTLKLNTKELVDAVNKQLRNYFGITNVPTFSVKVPRLNTTTYGNGQNSPEGYLQDGKQADIEISLISAKDGKHTIAELTKTLADLALKKEIHPNNINIDLVNSELIDLSGYEPDLLILFGPELDLQGYPPWQIRLSEIFWEADNDSVNYVVFYNALRKFSTCKVNIGK